jgi:hypothetical protein
VNAVLEIAVGLDRAAIERSMRAGIDAACRPGVDEITAGNYAGKSGKDQFRLHALWAPPDSHGVRPASRRILIPLAPTRAVPASAPVVRALAILPIRAFGRRAATATWVARRPD